MKFGKLGLGFGSGNFNNRPPYYTLLDQLLKGNIIPATGVIADSIGNYPAQLVEQPCGVFNESTSNVELPPSDFNFGINDIFIETYIQLTAFTGLTRIIYCGSATGGGGGIGIKLQSNANTVGVEISGTQNGRQQKSWSYTPSDNVVKVTVEK